MLRKFLILSFIAALVACKSVPSLSEKTTRLTAEQIQKLQSAGFIQDKNTGDWYLNLDGQILFDTWKTTLNTDGKSTIINIVELLKKLGLNSIVVEGHTDNTGTPKENERLSAARAKSVADELAKQGLSYANITQKAFGDTRPLETNKTPEGRAKNRRVTLIVVAGS